MDSSAYGKIFAIEEKLWWYKYRRQICFGLLDRYLASGPQRDILDVGCGTGFNVGLLQRYGRAQGVDMSEDALEFCRRRGVEQVQLQSADSLPFQEESFDLLTAFDVIEHIEDDRSALREFGRVLRPGGWMLIYTPALPWLYNDHDRIVHHKRRYLRTELQEKITSAGFELEHLSYANALVLPLVLLARGLQKLRGGGGHQEMELPHPLINSLVSMLCSAEAPLVRSGTLPIGMSLVAIARKAPPGDS